MTIQQWSGSIPSTNRSQDSELEEPFFPTDADLLEALEEYEKQEEEERLLEAAGDDLQSQPALGSTPEGGSDPEPGEHRRRRMLAAAAE